MLYRRVAEAFPDAWIEDPALTAETDAVLAAHRERFSWDAPIHSIADIQALPYPPRMVNIKPSRLGGLRNLLDAYDYCAAQGIGNYGGGQFELGVGRGQIQYLASLFHADAPNDVAPDRLQPAGPASRACRRARCARRPRRRGSAGRAERRQRNFRVVERFAQFIAAKVHCRRSAHQVVRPGRGPLDEHTRPHAIEIPQPQQS